MIYWMIKANHRICRVWVLFKETINQNISVYVCTTVRKVLDTKLSVNTSYFRGRNGGALPGDESFFFIHW